MVVATTLTSAASPPQCGPAATPAKPTPAKDRPAPQGRLILVQPPTVIIDPFCNPEASGTGWVKIRNRGSTSVSLFLRASELSGKTPVKYLDAEVEAKPVAAPGDDKPSGKTVLAPKEESWVILKVSGVHEDGEWQTTLQNENVDVGKVAIVKRESQCHLSLAVPNPNAPELRMVSGELVHFALKNDDPKAYCVTWEYTINGMAAHGGNSEACDNPRGKDEKNQPFATSADKVVVPAKGRKDVLFSPPNGWFGSCRWGWFGSCFAGLFKDQPKDGWLMISRVVEGRAATAQVFNIKTHLDTRSGNMRELKSDIVVFVFLLVGGICSVTLGFTLPNQMRRLNLRATLAGLDRGISDLSNHLSSRLRVLVGLQKNLLDDRLRRLNWTNSDFAAEIQGIDQAAARLKTRILLLDELGMRREDFERLRSHRLPPTQVMAMETAFEKIVEIGKKSDPSDAEIQTAQKLIDDLKKQLDSAGQKDDALEAELVKSHHTLADTFLHDNHIRKTVTCETICSHLNGLFTILERDPEVSPERYVALDTALFKLNLIREYVLLVEGISDPADPVRKRITDHSPELLDLLKNDSWEALSAAKSLLSQMQEGKFKEDIQNALKYPQLRIRPEHIDIRQFEPCEFKLEFSDAAWDRATAREDWTCRWEFSHPLEPTLKEEGWEITHYFQRPERYEFHVKLTHKSGDPELEVTDPNFLELDHNHKGPCIKVLPEKRRRITRILRIVFSEGPRKAWAEWKHYKSGASRFLLEFLWFGLALVIVLIGMIAGAKEQLLKLDLVPALIAIFLAGFGADQIKKLLTERQP